MDVLFIYLNYTEGTLTPNWAMWIVAVGSAASIIVAILVWTTITLPRLRLRKSVPAEVRTSPKPTSVMGGSGSMD